jgi:uncharacterized repeat protein (TIGR03843 family)
VPALERPQPADQVMSALAAGELELRGRMPWSSNNTFLAAIGAGTTDEELLVVYKPERGERPLWDFPGGLWRREVAAYRLAGALGWPLVPETIVRDGPLGPGSVQRFVDADFEQHYFTLVEDPTCHADLVRICVFDLLLNNADRKSGHCLLGTDGQIWAIDHGLCFHTDPKLRTVIWEFAGCPIPLDVRETVSRFATEPPTSVLELLDADEGTALLRRAAAVAALTTLPMVPEDRRPYPWPLV